MEHTKHLWRVALLLVVLGGGGVVFRHFLIPPSFGAAGFYRYDSLSDYMSQPAIHGTSKSCVECHAEIAESKASGIHAAVSCEVCHGPVRGHAAGGEKTADMPVDRSERLCAVCHEQLEARPKDFPQKSIQAHMAELDVVPAGEAIPEGTCIACHDPHGQ